MTAFVRSVRLHSWTFKTLWWIFLQIIRVPYRIATVKESPVSDYKTVRVADPQLKNTHIFSQTRAKTKINWPGDKVLHLVLLGAVITSVVSLILAYKENLITAFRDGEARLIIARLVVDSNNPGFTNLAGNWPPSPHAEWVPFIWNDYMYQSGLAGSVVSMIWYIVAVYFIYRLIVLLTNDRSAAVIGVIAFSAPNLLFMQTTPMSEVPFIGRMVMAIYFLTCWIKYPEKAHYLFISGFAFSWATLTRYESWGLFPIMIFILIVAAYKNGFSLHKTHAHMHVFAPIAVSGIAGWLGLNWIIFGDPLFFARSEFSAGQIAERTFANLDPDLQTAGNLSFIMQNLGTSALDIIGLPLIVLALFGAIRLLFSKRSVLEKFVALSLVYPIFFYIVTMYFGFSTVIWHPDYFDGQNWGTRYLTLMLPAAGLLCGILVSNRGLAVKLPILVILLGSAFITMRGELLTVHEARAYQRDPATEMRIELANWLDENYDRGLVLLFRVGHEKIFRSETIPLDRLVYEGSNPEFWRSSLEDPVEQHIDWIVMRNNLNGKPDTVWNNLRGTSVLRDNYYLVYEDEEVEVYKIQPGKDRKSQARETALEQN